MARLNVYIFHCSRCGEPAYSLLKERTPGGIESGDTIFPTIDLKAIRAQCSACKHTQFRDAWGEGPFRATGVELGQLYEADCLDFLKTIAAESVHTFFADPPSNLRRRYGRKGSDSLPDEEYLHWR